MLLLCCMLALAATLHAPVLAMPIKPGEEVIQPPAVDLPPPPIPLDSAADSSSTPNSNTTATPRTTAPEENGFGLIGWLVLLTIAVGMLTLARGLIKRIKEDPLALASPPRGPDEDAESSERLEAFDEIVAERLAAIDKPGGRPKAQLRPTGTHHIRAFGRKSE